MVRPRRPVSFWSNGCEDTGCLSVGGNRCFVSGVLQFEKLNRAAGVVRRGPGRYGKTRSHRAVGQEFGH